MQGHQLDPGAVALQLVGVGHQRHRLEELGQVLVLVGHPHQLGDVLDTAVRLVAALGHQLGQVARAVGHRLHQIAGRHRSQQRPQLVEQGGQLLGPPEGLAGQAGLGRPADRLGEGDVLQRGPGAEAGDRGRPDPPLGHVDHPAGRHLVGGVGQQADVGQQVLDLPAVVEAGAPDHLVGNALAHQLLLQHPALGVGAVEDGHVAVAQALGAAEPEDLRGHPGRLVALVLGAVAEDRRPGLAVGEEALGPAALVVGDDRVGGVEDVLGRTEVLLQQDGGGVGEGLLELQDVADVGAPPAVDRLVRVADHADVAVLAPEQHDELVLGPVGVLVLVDQDVAEPLLVGRPHVVAALQQVDRHHQQVVEVHGVGRQQPLLVLA